MDAPANLDADLAAIWAEFDGMLHTTTPAALTVDQRINVVAQMRAVLATQADRKRNELCAQGMQNMVNAAETPPYEWLAGLFRTMSESYMKPATTSQTQTVESMQAEATADARRLGLAVKAVWAEYEAAVAATLPPAPPA